MSSVSTRGRAAHYSKQKLIELAPNKKVTWLVTETDLSFVDKTDEWKGTHISFEISLEHGKTKITFIDKGLAPESLCYEACVEISDTLTIGFRGLLTT